MVPSALLQYLPLWNQKIIKPIVIKINVNYVWILTFRPYVKQNTFRLCKKNYLKNNDSFYENRVKCLTKLAGKGASFLFLKSDCV
jgi:hypothetical protein